MIGCLRRLGCLVVALAVLAASAWFSRGYWLPKLGWGSSRQVQAATWEGPTDAGARRADAALKQLQSRSGPAFANFSAGDLLSLIVNEVGKAMPRSADSLRATVIGDRVYVRGTIRTADLGREVLGPLAALLRERERVVLGGTLRVIRPGLSELQVKEVNVGSLRLPQAAIPALLKQLGGERPPELAADGVALATPDYIGDVRVANGRITVYKNQ
jgi:hypothetical protein